MSLSAISSVSQTSEPVVGEAVAEHNLRLTGQPVNAAFVVRYILALVGVWIALLTPASVTLAIRLSQIDPVNKAAALASVASLGAAAALFANPIFGALSDHSTSRWGPRRPFIVGGLAFGLMGLVAIDFADSMGMICLGWVAAQLAFNAAITALIAVLPERVPARMRGRVAGFMGMAPQLGIVVGTYLVQLVGTGGHGMFAWPAVSGALLMLPFVLTLEERPRTRDEVGPLGIRTLLGALWINPLLYRDFALAWAGRACVWITLYLLTNYKIYFLMDRLGYTDATVAPTLTIVMSTLALCIMVSSIAGGWASDCMDRRKPFVVAASLLFAVTMFVVAFATTLRAFLLGIALSGLAAGLYLGVDYALVSHVLPNTQHQAARGMGLFNLSSTVPQMLAPILAPLFLAIHASGRGGNYVALFLAGACFSLAGALLTQLIRTR